MSFEKLIFGLTFSVCLIVPFSNDVFISGFPAMSKHFTGENISLVLSMFFFGSAITQPFYGPFSDRFGRKPVLLVGLWIFVIASAIVMLSIFSFNWLLVGRFFQALGACSATVSVLAIIRDTYHDKSQLLKATSTYTAVISAGPALAPLLGSFLNEVWGWRASFIFLFVLGIFYTAIIHIFLKETHHEKNLNAIKLKYFLGNYIALIKQNGFFKYCILGAIPYAIFFTYFSVSAFFIMRDFGFGVIGYGFIIAMNGFIMILPRLSPWPTQFLSLENSLCVGYSIVLAGGLCMWVSNAFFISDIYTFMLSMAIVTIGIGIIRPVVSAAALHSVEKSIAGSASALFNMVSFVSSALATGLLAQHIHHIYTFGIIITLMSGITLLVYSMCERSC